MGITWAPRNIDVRVFHGDCGGPYGDYVGTSWEMLGLNVHNKLFATCRMFRTIGVHKRDYIAIIFEF